jgi:hypothetical protein
MPLTVALRPYTLDRIIIQQHFQFIFMYSLCGITKQPVAVAGSQHAGLDVVFLVLRMV